jgi:hypothetical protein
MVAPPWYPVPQDEDALAAAITDVGRLDPERCREHVERNYSVPAVAERYDEVFQQAVAGEG